MNPIIKNQLNKLTVYTHTVDDLYRVDFPDNFQHAIFAKREGVNTEIQVTFEDYVIRPFDGFDMNIKFNGGINPPEKIMYGTIVRETEKMYLFNLHTISGERFWNGWCYKKSCRIK